MIYSCQLKALIGMSLSTLSWAFCGIAILPEDTVVHLDLKPWHVTYHGKGCHFTMTCGALQDVKNIIIYEVKHFNKYN